MHKKIFIQSLAQNVKRQGECGGSAEINAAVFVRRTLLSAHLWRRGITILHLRLQTLNLQEQTCSRSAAAGDPVCISDHMTSVHEHD